MKHPNDLERGSNARYVTGMSSMRRFFWALVFSAGLIAFGQEFRKAEELYQHTDYYGSLKVLQAVRSPDAEIYCLMGKNYYMVGDLKKATDFFQKASALAPKNSDYAVWLGRAWGRRAETASPFT